MKLFALSHHDYLVPVADDLVGRAVQGNEKCVFDRRRRIGVKKVEPERRAAGREKFVWSNYVATAFGTLQFRVGKHFAIRRMTIWPAVVSDLVGTARRSG